MSIMPIPMLDQIAALAALCAAEPKKSVTNPRLDGEERGARQIDALKAAARLGEFHSGQLSRALPNCTVHQASGAIRKLAGKDELIFVRDVAINHTRAKLYRITDKGLARVRAETTPAN